MAVCYTVTLISSALSVSPIAKIYNRVKPQKSPAYFGYLCLRFNGLGADFFLSLAVVLSLRVYGHRQRQYYDASMRHAELPICRKKPRNYRYSYRLRWAARHFGKPYLFIYGKDFKPEKNSGYIFRNQPVGLSFRTVIYVCPTETQNEKPEYFPDKAEFKNIKFITVRLGILLLTASSPVANQLAVYAKDLDFGSRAAGFAVSRSWQAMCRQTCLWGGGKGKRVFSKPPKFLLSPSVYLLFCSFLQMQILPFFTLPPLF